MDNLTRPIPREDSPKPPAPIGLKYDQGKMRYDLLPPELLHGVSAVLTYGADKYGDRNWEKGIKYGRVFGALMRHLWAWWGAKIWNAHPARDAETGYSHLWHAGCCLAFLITYETRAMLEWDDRPTPIPQPVVEEPEAKWVPPTVPPYNRGDYLLRAHRANAMLANVAITRGPDGTPRK